MKGLGQMRIAAVLALAVALGAAPALAEKGGNGGGNGGGHGNPHGGDHGGGPGKGQKSKGGERQGGGGAPAMVVTTHDRQVIREYFVSYPVGVTSLPPGIAKKLARGKPLPPGIAKKQAPYALVQRVPMCMNGWECILLGADMLILDAVHGTIHDIIRGVVR